jgi:HK97 family phage prohead protease
MSDETMHDRRGEDLYREVLTPDFAVREANSDGTDTPTLTGHFAVTNQWTEINSIYEGRFMERFAPGAFKKTLRERGDKIKVLFQHGRDPQIGDKPLGAIRDVREDNQGAYYEVPLLDAPYVRETLLPGLRAGLYGASFRFQVETEAQTDHPDPSEHNPRGLPERTVKEARVMEFGPVTFPAYEGASADVRSAMRSLTDSFRSPSVEAVRQRMLDTPEQRMQFFDHLMGIDAYRAEFFALMVDDPNELRAMVRDYLDARSDDAKKDAVAPLEAGAETRNAPSHSDLGSRDSRPLSVLPRKENRSWHLSPSRGSRSASKRFEID